MAVQENLQPAHREKNLGGLKAERAVKRITFNPSEANPGETLYVLVPQLIENEVIVPGSLVLHFNIDLSGGHADNLRVDNVSRALIDKFALSCRTRTVTTSTRFTKIFSYRKRSATTGFLRAFRQRTSTKSDQILVIRKHRASMPKTS